MTPSEFSEQFIASIEHSARLLLPTEEHGRVLAAFTVVGGGTGCIVLRVEDMVVRLTDHGGLWLAEHLVARGRGE